LFSISVENSTNVLDIDCDSSAEEFTACSVFVFAKSIAVIPLCFIFSIDEVEKSIIELINDKSEIVFILTNASDSIDILSSIFVFG